MAGAREYGEVKSYPAQDGESFDTDGYLLGVDGNGRVAQLAAGGTAPFGVNYVSTEGPEGETIESLSQDDPVDTVRESAGFPLQGDAVTYTAGDDVYVSANNAGQVSTSDDAGAAERVGRVVEGVDHSGGADGDDNPVLVSFNFN